MQIQLMISLGVPPLPSLQHLRRDSPLLPPLLLHLLRHLLRRGLLLRRMVEDGAAVLRAGVAALAVLGGGVVHLVEEFEEGGVGDARGVEGHLEGFGVCHAYIHISVNRSVTNISDDREEGGGRDKRHTASPSGAYGAIAGVAGVATDVPDSRIVETLVAKVLAEEVFDAPEATGGDGAFLRGVGDVLSATFGGTETHL